MVCPGGVSHLMLILWAIENNKVQQKKKNTKKKSNIYIILYIYNYNIIYIYNYIYIYIYIPNIMYIIDHALHTCTHTKSCHEG